MKRKEITFDDLVSCFRRTKGEVKAKLTSKDAPSFIGTFFEGSLSKIPFIYAPCVYVLRESGSGKFYIGSTKDAYVRLLAHRYTLSIGENKNPNLQQLYNDSTEALFDIKIFTVANREAAFDLEQLLLFKFFGSEFCLNASPTARSPLGFKHSEETKEKFSTIAANRTIGESTRKKISATLTNRPLDPEHAAKVAASNSARWDDPEFRKKWLDKRGKKVTVDGVPYDSASHAARAFSIGTSTAHRRFNNPNVTNWQFVA